jgi:hypothetical protein
MSLLHVVRIAGLRAKIWTQYPPTIQHEFQPHSTVALCSALFAIHISSFHSSASVPDAARYQLSLTSHGTRWPNVYNILITSFDKSSSNQTQRWKWYFKVDYKSSLTFPRLDKCKTIHEDNSLSLFSQLPVSEGPYRNATLKTHYVINVGLQIHSSLSKFPAVAKFGPCICGSLSPRHGASSGCG